MAKSRKLLSKLKTGRKQPETRVKKAPERVTNDSVSKHRDEVLTKGRQFKYPFSWSKHRVVFISTVVGLLALVLLGFFTALRLYRWHSYDDFTYGVARIIPFPVAKVDGKLVMYKDYLFDLRPSLHWERSKGYLDANSPDGKRQTEYYKRRALDKAVMNVITNDMAHKNKISVSEKEIDQRISTMPTAGTEVSEVTQDQYGFGLGDLREFIRRDLLRKKVAQKLDTEAPKKAAEALKQLDSGKPFSDVAKKYSNDLETAQLGGDVGIVEKGFAKYPSQVSDQLFKLQPKQHSKVIEATDGYYIVSVTEKVDENRVRASIIKVNVKSMADYLKDYKAQNKIKEYIKLQDIKPINQ